MHYYAKTAADSEPKVRTIDLSALQGLPVPSGGGSPTASVSSFSLPPTPRMSRSSSVNSNGISRQGSARNSAGGSETG